MKIAYKILIHKSDKNDFMVVPKGQVNLYKNYHLFLTNVFSYSEAHEVLDRWKADKFEANGQ